MINSFTPATTILSSQVNANFSDIATGLSNVLTRDNQAPMTAPLRLADGSAPLPGLQFANDVNTGLRRSATDEMRWVAGGLDRMFIDAAGKMWALGALDVTGLANFQAAITGLTAALAAAATPLTLRRTENDGVEREIASWQSGSGAGDKFSRRITGNAANGVAAVSDFIGAVANTAFSALVRRFFVPVTVGPSGTPRTVLHPDGYADMVEIAVPANPAADTARTYAFDDGGITMQAYRDSAGVVRTLLGRATQAEMEAATDVRQGVSAGRQHFHPGHPKAGGNLNGSGTPAFAAGDYGMGAVTDSGLGLYLLALDTAFENTNYWFTGSARSTNNNGVGIVSSHTDGPKTSSTIEITTAIDSGDEIDSVEIGLTFWGDYA